MNGQLSDENSRRKRDGKHQFLLDKDGEHLILIDGEKIVDKQMESINISWLKMGNI